MTTRRDILLALGTGALAAPFSARLQAQPRLPRVVWFTYDPIDVRSPFLDAFRKGLRDLGYGEDRNIKLEVRGGLLAPERLDELAAEVVRSSPDIIVAQGGSGLAPVRRAKAAMPVVFGFSGDPVEAKIVESLARPGGNMTGVSFLALELVGKRIEILKEIVPGAKRVAILANPEHPGEQSERQASGAAARKLGISVDYFEAKTSDGLDAAMAAALKARCDGVVVFSDGLMMRHRERLAAFFQKAGVPVICGWAQFADAGCLLTYGPNLRDAYGRLAFYVDKILRGTRPADIPVELPTTIETVINLKTARALGIRIPQTILVRADRVIK
jgi:putative ABC transport system substrate-binding protein